MGYAIVWRKGNGCEGLRAQRVGDLGLIAVETSVVPFAVIDRIKKVWVSVRVGGTITEAKLLIRHIAEVVFVTFVFKLIVVRGVVCFVILEVVW